MTNTNSSTNPLSQLENLLDKYLVKKAPFTLPDGWREAVVKFAPWFSLILMIVALPALLALFGLGAIFTPLSYLGGLQTGVNYTFGLVIAAVTVVLNGMAIPGLFKRTRQGWNFVFYATLVGVVENAIHFNIGGLVIGSLISLFILFQVKTYYK